MLSCLRCSELQFALMLWILFTPTCARTTASPTPSVNWQVGNKSVKSTHVVHPNFFYRLTHLAMFLFNCFFQVTRPAQSPGAQEELLLVFHVWEVVVLTVLVRVLLETYPLNQNVVFQALFFFLFHCLQFKCNLHVVQQWWCNLRLTVWPVTECLLS